MNSCGINKKGEKKGGTIICTVNYSPNAYNRPFVVIKNGNLYQNAIECNHENEIRPDKSKNVRGENNILLNIQLVDCHLNIYFKTLSLTLSISLSLCFCLLCPCDIR